MARTPPRHSDARVLEAWRENAAPWTQIVRTQEIESRRLVTDRAVVGIQTAAGFAEGTPHGL